MEITRHFTATTLVVHEGKMLLHLHKKINLWLPVGGHVERDELPEDAAIREVKEESGLDVQLYNADPNLELKDAKQTVRPAHILLVNINEHHQHIDFLYYATSRSSELHPENPESNSMRWLTRDEVENLDMPTNVKVCALEALTLLS